MNAAAVLNAIAHYAVAVLFALALAVAYAKLKRAGAAHVVATPAYVYFGEILFYCVGIGLLRSFVPDAFLSGAAAASSGWKPSPYEWELAWAQCGIAVVALMALWRGYEFRLAATLAFGIFTLGSALRPAETGWTFWGYDIALPLLLLALAFTSREAYERSLRH